MPAISVVRHGMLAVAIGAMACLVSTAAPAAAATVTFKAQSGSWFEAANWQEGALPKDGDLVVIPANCTATIDRRTPQLGDLVVRGTVVLHKWDTAIAADNLTVEATGVITLPEPFRTKDAANRIVLECRGKLTIHSGGRIDAHARGFAGGVGHQKNDDPSSAGYGPGAGGYPAVWGPSAGGSHGGRGGTPSAANAYGSADAPEEPGSGGGGGNGVGGGAGGGAIRIRAANVVIDGAIIASGGDGIGSTYGGGGSGGSVLVQCQTIVGQGKIVADGGTGSIYAGGGGGGRIAIVYDAAAQAKVDRPDVTYSAVGGANGIGPFGTEEPKNFGEVGTIFFSATTVPGRVLPQSAQIVGQPEGKLSPREMSVAYWMPWRINSPIVEVKKELFRKHAAPKAAAMGWRAYVGPRLEMVEFQMTEARDDVPSEKKMRFSADNGRTWSEFEPITATLSYPKGVEVWEGAGANVFDPQSGLMVDTWLRQIQEGNIWAGGICNCFTYFRTSADQGRTWTTPRQLRYQPGDDFDPNEPLKPTFLRPNQAYYGSNILLHSNGTLIHCVAHANVPGDADNDKRTWKMGSLCFIGRWNPERKDYEWRAGKPVSISPTVSSRGLMEPALAELTDGRVLVVWRGSDTPTVPGRKWFSVSTDGAQTLSEVRELKYDDGTQFYSPSSYHNFLRHSQTKKLYWFGNITAVPPQGNSPRFPLVIAEVDESIPALKKSTVTTIDDRDPYKHGFGYQLSNFPTFENRETHDIEMFLTTYGQELNQDDWLDADNFHYILKVK